MKAVVVVARKRAVAVLRRVFVTVVGSGVDVASGDDGKECSLKVGRWCRGLYADKEDWADNDGGRLIGVKVKALVCWGHTAQNAATRRTCFIVGVGVPP